MEEFLNLVVGGIVAGGLYAILAAGVVLTYQTSGIFNFAHGAVAFATAYLFVQLNVTAGIPIIPAAVIAVLVFAPLLGFVLDRLIYRRLTQSSVAVKIVVPVGLLIAVPGICLFVSDRFNLWFDWHIAGIEELFLIPGLGPTPKKVWTVGTVLLDSNQVAVFGAAVLTAAGLWVLLRHTRLGLHMRAVVDRRGLAALRGIDPDRTSAISWMLGSFLAGLAGVLLAPIFTLNTPVFTTVVLISTPAVVFARFRSIPLALAGGLLIGVVQNLIVGYAHFAENITGFSTSVPFILLFLLLFVFAVDRSRRAGTQTDDDPPAPSYGEESRRRKTIVWSAWSVIVLAYALFVADDYWQSLIIRGLALSVVLLSFTVVTGVGGMVSLAQAAFVTASGITAGWVVSHHWPFAVALVLGTLVATAMGVVVSLPARRLGGLPLALATLALAYICQNLFFQLRGVSRNDVGGWVLRPPALGPVDLADSRSMIIFLAIVLGIVVLLVRNLIRSSSGRAMAALRATEPGTVTIGVSAARTKTAVFALSAAIAGFGGVLLAASSGRVTHLDYPVETGLFWLATVVLFGVRRPGAAVIAGFGAALSPELLSHVAQTSYLPQVLSGLAAINLAQNPDGILALTAQQRFERRRRREERALRKEAVAAPAVATPVDVPAAAPLVDTPPAATLGAAPAAGVSDKPLVLEVTGVRAGYGAVEVLHGVDLALRAGEVLALIGANGAGKSTLCAVVAGGVPATRGTVRLGGADVTGLPPHRRVRHGAFLIPEGRGIFPALTVDENLSLWLPAEQDRDSAYRRFPVLGERRGQLAGSLSGGEQQMLALAPALVKPPALLIVDEPSLGLAPLVVAEVYAALRELRAAGTAILLVEEKAHDVVAFADSIAFMAVGRVAWERRTAQVDSDLLVQSYLGISEVPTGPPERPAVEDAAPVVETSTADADAGGRAAQPVTGPRR
ncbi:ABC transporter permease subunit [Pseudofrankia sp. BMG5.37]|uniref:ABC transporter permease subunit n=1 Tax=Pseudofrankia sp. BMG5.37 TaxID=3050035 RepID=UPI0028942D9C|nr:ATP-binding cassette domain-containing protein [Pseudofrankia sp. BMG5.37]MDT3440605.1 ATP-binding cassette domain-containing protein [Pseudofrankia sp. BMG5.37]